MADILIQKCNSCGIVNTTNDMSWIRIFGASIGNTQRPFQRPGSGLPNNNPSPRQIIDFCPLCASKLTIDKIPSFYQVYNIK